MLIINCLVDNIYLYICTQNKTKSNMCVKYLFILVLDIPLLLRQFMHRKIDYYFILLHMLRDNKQFSKYFSAHENGLFRLTLLPILSTPVLSSPTLSTLSFFKK